MDKHRILHNSARAVFLGAAAAIVLAFVEWGANFLGSSLIGYAYAPGRILELSATLLIYVVAVFAGGILRQLQSR
jgi:hypothetical protein